MEHSYKSSEYVEITASLCYRCIYSLHNGDACFHRQESFLDKAIEEYNSRCVALVIFCGNSTSFGVKASCKSLVIAVSIPYIVDMHVFHGQELVQENIFKKCNASQAAMVIFCGTFTSFDVKASCSA